MNKQFLKDNKWTLLEVALNTVAVLYSTKNLVGCIKELKDGGN